MLRRLRLLLVACSVAFSFFIGFNQWQVSAAIKEIAPPVQQNERSKRGPYRMPVGAGQRSSERRAPSPAIDPYVRQEFAAEMVLLRPAILAAAQRHNRPALSGMRNHDFAVVIALILYNEHFGWFEERVRPVRAFTPLYEDLQRQTNEAGLSDLSVWPANIRPSVALEILRQQVPLPHSTQTITEPIGVAGSRIRPAEYNSQNELYSAITAEITQPDLAVEYLAANLERGLYRAQYEGVTVTWRALAAWHNQGIVAPEELRANIVASDYVHRASAYFGKARLLIDTPPQRIADWKYAIE